MIEQPRETHMEKIYERNVRYICYSLLKNVVFNNEPVVPKILGERVHEWLGAVFDVEKLPGRDLVDYLGDPQESKLDKLLVMLQVVRQLKAIDSAGYVIFDRHGNNIRVLSSKPDNISVRQMDIEDMYDKQGDCMYSLFGASMSDELVDIFKEKGLSLWVMTVDKLAVEGELIGELHDDQTIVDIFSLCRWERGEKGHSLDELEMACLRAIEMCA